MPLVVALAAYPAPAESVGAADHSAILREAFGAIDKNYLREWAYTETSVDSDGTTIGRYDPRRLRGERWALLSVDGRAPTAEETAEYDAEKYADDQMPDNNGDDTDSDVENGVSDMVVTDSLSLIEETDEYWLFSFIPAEEEEGFRDNVVGTLRIAKAGRYLEFIDLHSSRPFKPQFGVKIREFLTRLSFGPATHDGPIVPLSIHISIDARAFLVKSVDERIATTFSDYEYVGE